MKLGKKSLSITLVVISLMLLFTCTTAFATSLSITNSVTHVDGQDSTNDNQKPPERNRTEHRIHSWEKQKTTQEQPTPSQPVEVPSEPQVTAPTPTPAPVPVVVPAEPAPAAPKELPKTGGDILLFIFPGIALVGAGLLIRRRMAV